MHTLLLIYINPQRFSENVKHILFFILESHKIRWTDFIHALISTPYCTLYDATYQLFDGHSGLDYFLVRLLVLVPTRFWCIALCLVSCKHEFLEHSIYKKENINSACIDRSTKSNIEVNELNNFTFFQLNYSWKLKNKRRKLRPNEWIEGKIRRESEWELGIRGLQ